MTEFEVRLYGECGELMEIVPVVAANEIVARCRAALLVSERGAAEFDIAALSRGIPAIGREEFRP